jgi:thiol-disulfide isomerase/thioredoxin
MNKRLHFLLIIAVLVGIIAIGFGGQIANSLTATLLLRQEAPDALAVRSVIEEANQPSSMVQRFWETERIPHRYLALSYLKDHITDASSLTPETESILIEAVSDVDNSVRELALGALSRLPHETFLPHVRRQLYDTDHSLKIKAVHYIKDGDFRMMAPDVISLLDDPEPLVVASAAGLLRRWTGEDFGVRNHDAVSKAQEEGPRIVPEENLERLRGGVENWKQWWVEHKTEFPQAHQTANNNTPPKLPTADFDLFDLEGNSVHLSDYRGKTVLLNFWTTWCTACAMEMPDLVELNKRYQEDLVILGISLDGSDGHGHGHASFVDLEEANEKGWDAVEGLTEMEHHDHDGHDHAAPVVDLPKIKKKIRRIVQKKGLTYPILLNPSGTIGNRFNGHELPTNVLIDKEGFVRRRFIGSRPIGVWEAMIKEIQ